MTLYTSGAVEDLARRYYENGGECYPIEEGSLLTYGLGVFVADGLKTAVIREVYLNCWSSAYSVRFYNNTPAKYERAINEYFNEIYCC